MPYHLPSGRDVSDPGLHPDPSASSGLGGKVVVDAGRVVVMASVVVVTGVAVVVVVGTTLVVDGSAVIVAPSPPVPQAATTRAADRTASRMRTITTISTEREKKSVTLCV
jgi:predicted metalloprotease